MSLVDLPMRWTQYGIEYQRNKERYDSWNGDSRTSILPMLFLRKRNYTSKPRVYRQRCWIQKQDKSNCYFPDSLVGTDSHTTMINGFAYWDGVLEVLKPKLMISDSQSTCLHQMVGFKLTGELRGHCNGHDATIVQMLRKHGVVGKFVEFYGPEWNNSRCWQSHDCKHGSWIWCDLWLPP